MKSKGHLIVSLIKSAIRILGCCLALCYLSIYWLAGSFLLAELLGVLEETLDQRG